MSPAKRSTSTKRKPTKGSAASNPVRELRLGAAARGARGTSIHEVATYSGCNPNTIRRLEAGDNVTIDTLSSIASALCCTADTLLGAWRALRASRGIK